MGIVNRQFLLHNFVWVATEIFSHFLNNFTISLMTCDALSSNAQRCCYLFCCSQTRSDYYVENTSLFQAKIILFRKMHSTAFLSSAFVSNAFNIGEIQSEKILWISFHAKNALDCNNTTGKNHFLTCEIYKTP